MTTATANEGRIARPAYDHMARFYAKYYGPQYAAFALAELETLLCPVIPPGSAILDAGCGTGDLAVLLAGRGYSVLGVDVSNEMLARARVRLPGAVFRREDMSSFVCQEPVDAVVCTCDALSHLIEPDAVQAAFVSFLHCLKPAGYVVFDTCTLDGFARRWSGTFTKFDHDSVLVSRAGFNRETHVGEARFTTFVQRADAWYRNDFSIVERLYSEAQLQEMLFRAGYVDVVKQVASDLLGTGREFYRARRPSM